MGDPQLLTLLLQRILQTADPCQRKMHLLRQGADRLQQQGMSLDRLKAGGAANQLDPQRQPHLLSGEGGGARGKTLLIDAVGDHGWRQLAQLGQQLVGHRRGIGNQNGFEGAQSPQGQRALMGIIEIPGIVLCVYQGGHPCQPTGQTAIEHGPKMVGMYRGWL